MNGTGDVSYVADSGATSNGGAGGVASVDGDVERDRLVAALAATDRRDAVAWLRLLRHDYAVAKAVGTRDVWARLATAYRGPASLPTDQRRSEAFALIQLDEARVKMCVAQLRSVALERSRRLHRRASRVTSVVDTNSVIRLPSNPPATSAQRTRALSSRRRVPSRTAGRTGHCGAQASFLRRSKVGPCFRVLVCGPVARKPGPVIFLPRRRRCRGATAADGVPHALLGHGLRVRCAGPVAQGWRRLRGRAPLH